MNLLVTGATGFIGSAFVRLARARGHRVGALVRPETWRARGSPRDEETLTWLPGTLAAPPWEAIARFAPEGCLHAAWIATPGVYLESPENADWLRWSVDFVRRARELAGVRRFLVLGTCIEYANDPARREPLHEERTPVTPVSFYARCKHDLRLALEAEASRASAGPGGSDFELCWGRVFYPYGPGEHPQRLASSLIRQLARGETLTLKTPDSTKDYLFIEDLAAALLLLLAETRVTGPVNLGTGEGVTVRRLAETVARLLDRPDLVKVAPVPPATPDPLAYVVADAARLRSLGWQPAWDLPRGLRQLAAELTAS